MPHTCRALVIHCLDFRFIQAIQNHLKEQGLLGNADLVCAAGSAKNLLDPTSQPFLLRQIELSKKLHGIKEVHLINHLDCGAYGGAAAFPEAAAELAAHAKDLQAATERIQQQHPELNVISWIAHIEYPEHEHDPRIWLEQVVPQNVTVSV